MTIATRLCIFTVVALAGLIAWQWSAATDNARDLTQLAVQQFDNDVNVPANLQQASLAQNWWPFVWPALVLAVGIVLFWDNVERWWKQEESKEDHV